MLLHFNLTSATCELNNEGLLNKDSEIYWTWKVYYYDEDNKKYVVWQGFSLGCEIDGGYSFNDSGLLYKMVNDPQFRIKLPALKEGENKELFLQLFCWESDQCTEIVKKSFTNESLNNLFEIFQKVGEKKDKVKEEIFDWLKNKDNNLLGALVSAGSINATSVQIAQGVFDLAGFAIDLVKSNGDDLIGIYNAALSISKNNSENYYRWTFNNDTDDWRKEKSEIPKIIKFESADAKNIIRTDARFSIFSEGPGVLI
jgi:hypothetical protein